MLEAVILDSSPDSPNTIDKVLLLILVTATICVMKSPTAFLLVVTLMAWAPIAATASLDISPAHLEAHHVKTQAVTYKSREATRLTDSGDSDNTGVNLALIKGAQFANGTIELELTGDAMPKSGPEIRGFTGIAFRVQDDAKHFECIYLRPLNARSQDQLQRNHSVQYVAEPDYPWERLRQETPGKYETYVDLVPGEWTKLRIEVAGEKARVYVNDAAQPTMIVNDLKHGNGKGGLALWIGPGVVAHFANLRVVPK